jgi:hypothetical protein
MGRKRRMKRLGTEGGGLNPIRKTRNVCVMMRFEVGLKEFNREKYDWNIYLQNG